MSAAAAAKLDDVSFGYDDVPALEGVSFRVEQGDFVGIVGPNGGGKTTLLKLMLGLLTPRRGTVRVFGLPPTAARRRVGYVPQAPPNHAAFPLTVLDLALMGRLRTGVAAGPYPRSDRQAALQALERVHIADLARRDFASLSGGQRQKALIARALACDAEMLLLDEPAANLDAAAEASLYELLDELNRELTIMMVTHDVAFVSSRVKTVFCVNRRVVRHATSELSEVEPNTLRDLLGTEARLVRHDLHCWEEPPDG